MTRNARTRLAVWTGVTLTLFYVFGMATAVLTPTAVAGEPVAQCRTVQSTETGTGVLVTAGNRAYAAEWATVNLSGCDTVHVLMTPDPDHVARCADMGGRIGYPAWAGYRVACLDADF